MLFSRGMARTTPLPLETATPEPSSSWKGFQDRYRNREWRAPIFRDLILRDVGRLGGKENLSLLDIGCGGGFDSDPNLQASLAQGVREYIGVEPDTEIQLGPWITSVYRSRFEDAVIPPASIDLAFAVMVLEHLEDPRVFWDKVYDVLKPGGIFWGFTVDARHWFATASMLSQKVRFKDWYLDRLHGKRGRDRYENYPVHYRTNSPETIERFAGRFRSRDVINFSRIGEVDYFTPRFIWPMTRSLDRLAIRCGWPGSIMAVRAVK